MLAIGEISDLGDSMMIQSYIKQGGRFSSIGTVQMQQPPAELNPNVLFFNKLPLHKFS